MTTKKDRKPPLKIQYNKGYSDFFNGNLNSPYKGDVQQKEWQRGFNAAYFFRQAKVKAKQVALQNQ
tara:strand:- start:543 stop:740 length:198 start_codon:yes stop_codon:yes gene_type:complete